jgi:hypothetical protein
MYKVQRGTETFTVFQPGDTVQVRGAVKLWSGTVANVNFTATVTHRNDSIEDAWHPFYRVNDGGQHWYYYDSVHEQGATQ